ncbi:hypothetical protein FRC17_010175 [Serendipita sp. 399]|nr:hypothetical protein FRC17_010175 [Serendipita sp. 399]
MSMRRITLRLAFPTVKPLEVLLTRQDITLRDVLDDHNLFLECKEKNQKLIAYLSKPEILKQLLGLVTDGSKDQAVNTSKYQHIAAEVLCSDIDEFVDGTLANDNALFRDFWERGMHSSGSPGDSVLLSHFCKVFVAFLTRKPHEVFSFIQSQSSALKDMLQHIEMPQVADVLLKILLLDREPTRASVVDWLCEQQLMKLLVQNVSAERDAAVHQSTLELVKNIILMSSFTPTPGRKEASVLSSNKLSRDLVSSSNSALLISHLFPHLNASNSSLTRIPSSSQPSSSPHDIENQVSSIMSTASIIMELIRKNNSDYFEQYLFLRAREHLMSVQENLLSQRSADSPVDDCKPALEAAMEDIMTKCGLVNLGSLISAICDHLHIFQERLKKPLSLIDPIPSTVGPTIPLTFERLRICELYGELLHYSNMLLPNRTPGTSPSYDEDGRLIGGLDALGDLAAAMMAEVDPEADAEEEVEEEEEVAQAEEEQPFPVSQQNRRRRSFASDSDSDGGSMINEELKPEASSLADAEETSNQETPPKGAAISPASSIENLVDRLSLVAPGSPKTRKPSISPFTPGTPAFTSYSKAGSVINQPIDSEAIVLEDVIEVSQVKSPGDALKSRFLELRIFSTLLDLVFQFPWNNLLHSVVYDILHQVLFGKVEGTMNRDLIISLFRDAELPWRILNAQNANDSQPSTQPRLGYMGHISLMAVDIVGALEKYPDDLLAIIEPLIPQPAWDNYVQGVYAETQRLENTVLGGPRPNSNMRALQTRMENGWGGDWNDDAEATSPVQTFRRTGTSGRQTAEFGPPEEAEEGDFHFNADSGFDNGVGWRSNGGSDSGDEHDEWLKSSNSTTLVSHHSRDAEEVGFGNAFEDDFQPLEELHQDQDYGFDDDGFGDFTDAESPATHFSANFEHEDFDFGEFKSGDADSLVELPLIRAHRHVSLAGAGHSRALLVPHLYGPRFHEMTNRGQEIKISLKDRIAALGLDNQGPATPSSNSSSNTQSSFSYGSLTTGSSLAPLAGVRDKAARFESIGGVPVPRGSFGLGAPAAFQGPRKSGELYGNRIPSGNRSPGSSPGRSLADDSGEPEFTRIRLRSINSPDEAQMSEELEIPMAISVIPPTPAFPPPEQAANSPKTTEPLSQTPEEMSPSVSEEDVAPTPAETINGAAEEVEIPIKTSPLTISQELQSIPESPVTTIPYVQPAYAMPTIAARRRSAILPLEPFTDLEQETSDAKEPPTSSHPIRSATLSPGSTPRRTRSQLSARGDSISSTGSVFISPPPDEGEISGGGSPSSPTLEALRAGSQTPDELVTPFSSTKAVDVTESLHIVSPTLSQHERHKESMTAEASSHEMDIAKEGASVFMKAEFGARPLRVDEMSMESISELAYLHPTPPQSHDDHASTQDEAVRSGSTSKLAAETASPARVMRELRQFGIDKQGIIISPPRRASVLSMMLPSPVLTPTDDEPVSSLFVRTYLPDLKQLNRQTQSKRLSLNHHLQSQGKLVPGSASFEQRLTSESPRIESNQPPVRTSSLAASFEKATIDDASPTTASTFSIPQSFSGTSDASHGGPSRTGSPQEVTSFAASLTATSFTLPSFTTSVGEPSSPSSFSSKSSVPFLRQQTEPSRTLTPSPPASFRSLYSSGRLPPSSRGPGPHPQSNKVPLLQRAVSLVSRALPPIPVEDLPRRTSSAFHVIRSRTSSKVKQDTAKRSAEFARASSSSDATVKDVSPRNSSNQGRMRTTSTPLMLNKVSSGDAPAVPPLPPVVVVQDSSDPTPIARMFMEQRNQSSRAPPTSYRPNSPTASISSAFGSMSSCGPGPVHLFSGSFDQGIFDAFPEVPNHIPSESVVARHSKGARPRILSSHSYSDLGDRTLDVFPPSPSRSEGGTTRIRSLDERSNGTIKKNVEVGDLDEFGNLKPPTRTKSSRKLIPEWDDDEAGETGWASVSITRSRIA